MLFSSKRKKPRRILFVKCARVSCHILECIFGHTACEHIFNLTPRHVRTFGYTMLYTIF